MEKYLVIMNLEIRSDISEFSHVFYNLVGSRNGVNIDNFFLDFSKLKS